MSLTDAFAQERRARLAAERLLEQKQTELFSANQKLSQHALSLSGEIVEKREEVQVVRIEAEELRGQNTQALSDLEKANDAVVIAERRLWDSIESIQDGFAVFDPNGIMIAANSAYLSVFDDMECVVPGIGYPQIVRILVEEGIVDIADATAKDWCNALLARWSSDELEPMTIKLWNGQFIKLVDRRTDEGGTVSLALNITDTIKYEEELKDARSKAEAANRAKSAFLANMSHELRTPMAGVVGMADLMADTSLSEEQQLYVETIKNSGESLLTLINEVLDFSKIEAEKLVLHPEPFELESCIQNVLTLLQPSIQDKDIDLIIDYDMFLPTCFIGDPGRIRQILTNLIGNAAKFTRQGHVLVRVVGLPMETTGEFRVHITIEDTGIGIPENMIDHIFGEFTQVEDERNRKFEGTGLGLAITRQLVELMGGEIWVDSEEGKGSSFGFQITMSAPQTDPSELEPVPDWVKRAILLDGQSTSNIILAKQLSMYGIDIASPGVDDLLRPSFSQPGDFLMIDQKLFGESGLDLLQRLRKAGVTAPAFLMQSGAPIAQGEDLPQVGVLIKPVSRKAVLSALSKVRQSANEPSVDALKSVIPVPPPETAPENCRKMRILAAEDNKTNRLVFSKLIRALNIELEFAENGREAIEKWQSFKPDLIFMDISMPEVDGKEATRRIRAAEVEKSVPRTVIVALTAHAMDGDDAEILAAGLDHYLTKPFRKAMIFERIRAELPDGVLAVFPDDAPAASGAVQVLEA